MNFSSGVGRGGGVIVYWAVEDDLEWWSLQLLEGYPRWTCATNTLWDDDYSFDLPIWWCVV